MTTWATPVEVQTYTGATVNDADISKAEAVLDTLTGVGDFDPLKLSRRDRRMLRLATAYQAVWMKEQADIYARHDVTSLTQDGGSFSTRDSSTLVLAPLAKAALNRCSWASSTTKKIDGRGVRRVVDPVVSDAHPWGRRI